MFFNLFGVLIPVDARSVSGKPFTKCTRIHRTNTSRSAIPAVVLIYTKRWLQNDACRLAVENLLYAARKRGLEPGIFCAIHTYDRRLNWHPHVHVSVICGDLNKHGQWG